MFRWTIGGTRFQCGVPLFVLIAACLTFDTTGTAILCVLASFLHEGGHIAALIAFSRQPKVIAIGLCGIRLTPDTRPLGYCRQCLMLAAGPAINLVCAAILWMCHRSPFAMMTHLVLGVFNLLPIEALDGGQILKCLISHFADSNTAERAVRVISLTVLFPLAVTGFFFVILYRNITLLAVTIYLIVRLFSGERI